MSGRVLKNGNNASKINIPTCIFYAWFIPALQLCARAAASLLPGESQACKSLRKVPESGDVERRD